MTEKELQEVAEAASRILNALCEEAGEDPGEVWDITAERWNRHNRGGLACVTPDSRPELAYGSPTGYLWHRQGDRNDHWSAIISRDRTWAMWREKRKGGMA